MGKPGVTVQTYDLTDTSWITDDTVTTRWTVITTYYQFTSGWQTYMASRWTWEEIVVGPDVSHWTVTTWLTSYFGYWYTIAAIYTHLTSVDTVVDSHWTSALTQTNIHNTITYR